MAKLIRMKIDTLIGTNAVVPGQELEVLDAVAYKLVKLDHADIVNDLAGKKVEAQKAAAEVLKSVAPAVATREKAAKSGGK